MRGVDERIEDVRRLLAAARGVYERRQELVPSLVRTTGLSPEGVLLGFDSLERDASDAALRSLVESAGDATHVHVILSANVFVGALRALALARAAAARVTIRPSSRDPVLTQALVAAARDPALSITSERDPGVVGADRIDVYGGAAAIEQVRACAARGVTIRAHGPGLGVAFVTRAADPAEASRLLARDVVVFDQRGCLSPRLVTVEGDAARAESFAASLHASLAEWAERVPRGTLGDDERADARRWQESLAFAGRVWSGPEHVVGLGDRLLVPPTGRHVQVLPASDAPSASTLLAPIAAAIVTVGSDDSQQVRHLAPPHARIAALGQMQRPPLDGPVDRRSA
ncbi:MAG TPA: acyl-CoA reductase [Polyangiaceae bacterium]